MDNNIPIDVIFDSIPHHTKKRKYNVCGFCKKELNNNCRVLLIRSLRQKKDFKWSVHSECWRLFKRKRSRGEL